MLAAGTTGTSSAEPRPSATSLQRLVACLAVASLVELLVLRTFTRTAVHIPALQAFAGPYEVVAWFGRYSYYVAVVLLLAALPLTAAALWRRRSPATRFAAFQVGLFLVVAVGARAGAITGLELNLVSVTAVGLAALSAFGTRDGRTAVAVGAFGLAFALSGSHTVLQEAAEERIAVVDPRWLLTAAEAVAIVFAVVAPAALRAAPTRRALVLAGMAGLLTLGMMLGNGSTTKVLLLWNEGISGIFPSVVYAAAAAALCATTAGLLGQGRVLAAVGLALLVTGGIGLHSTYQTGLVLVGLGALLLASYPTKLEPAQVAVNRAPKPR